MRENFTQIDNEWMGKELKLSNPYEREVFAHIYRMTVFGRGGWHGSVRELAGRLYYSKSTIAKAVQELIKKGLILKEGDAYRSIPLKNDTETTPEDGQNMDTSVQNVDTEVHNPDNIVQDTDSLPPTTPITNNKREPCGEHNADETAPAADNEEKKNEILFDIFWTAYGGSPKWQDEKNACERLWDKKSALHQRLIIDELAEFVQRDNEGPYNYLYYFKPRNPFFLMKDEVDGYLQEGTDIAIVATYSRTRIATLKEAELFGMDIIRILRAADYKKPDE